MFLTLKQSIGRQKDVDPLSIKGDNKWTQLICFSNSLKDQ